MEATTAVPVMAIAVIYLVYQGFRNGFLTVLLIGIAAGMVGAVGMASDIFSQIGGAIVEAAVAFGNLG